MPRSGFRNEGEGSLEKSEDRTAKTPAVSRVPRKDTETDKDHGAEKTTLKICSPMQHVVGTAFHTPLSESLRENGKIEEWVGKIGGEEAPLGS